MWLYSSTTFPDVSSALARKVLGTVGSHIPLPCVVGQSALLKEAMVSPSYFIKQHNDRHSFLQRETMMLGFIAIYSQCK